MSELKKIEELMGFEGNPITPLEMRTKIAYFERFMHTLPDAKIGDAYPLKHEFINGIYYRTIYAPKGEIIITKLHKTEHKVLMLKGDVSILTENGFIRKQAPCLMTSEVGAKRVCFIHEDTEWINIHANPENIDELEVLENNLIAKNYSEIGLEEPILEELEDIEVLAIQEV